MTVKLDTRIIESADVSELYISAVPGNNQPLQKQAEDVFGQISEILRLKKAYILQERIFASKEAVDIILKERSKSYGEIDDGVAPSILSGKTSGVIEGVQVHAIQSAYRPEVIKTENIPCGRIFRMPDMSYLATSYLYDVESSDIIKQIETVLKRAKTILEGAGANILNVPRTWMWLGDILSWYNKFNEIRNKFFTEWGAIGKTRQLSMPASTGVGIWPANGGKCAMELSAVSGSGAKIGYLLTSQKQKSAFDYGSAFSRATIATTPAGKTLFISGTASIDENGATTNVGDAAAQIRATIENIRAILIETNFGQNEMVQAIAYCKTAEVKKVFDAIKDEVDWPWVTVICDICRNDLLFEAEAAAVKNAKKP